MKNEIEAIKAIEKYADTVRRICFIHLKNYSDVEDVFQDVFLKYLLHDRSFESEEHEKAWIIRVSINCCKDVLKSFFKRNISSIELMNVEPFYMQDENREILDAILRLPHKYRNVIYLFYYEGYTAVEIARALNKSQNTIYTWLSRAKSKLKDTLGGETF